VCACVCVLETIWPSGDHAYTHLHTHTYTYTHIYTYAHIHIHTYTYTHILRAKPNPSDPYTRGTHNKLKLTHAHMHTQLYTPTVTHPPSHPPIYPHTHTHTPTHTHITLNPKPYTHMHTLQFSAAWLFMSSSGHTVLSHGGESFRGGSLRRNLENSGLDDNGCI